MSDYGEVAGRELNLGALARARRAEKDHNLARAECRLVEQLFEKGFLFAALCNRLLDFLQLRGDGSLEPGNY